MSYTPTEWTDEVPASTPVKYTVRDSGGSILYDDVTIEVKTSLTPGTQLNAANMNKLEGGVEDNADDITSILADMAGMLPDAFTAAGQIPYASAAGAMALLAAGNAGKALKMNAAGNGIEWADAISAYFAQYSGSYVVTTSYADVTDLSVSVTTIKPNAKVLMLVSGRLYQDSSAGIYLQGIIDSVADPNVLSLTAPSSDINVPFSYIYYATVAAASTFTAKLQAKKSAGAAAVSYVKMAVLAI